MLIGLPASGKTSFYRERFAQSHAHVSKDAFPRARNRARRQARLIREALSRGCSVVLDNTNINREQRQQAIALARESGARVVGYYFPSTPSECLARNQARQGRARVPAVAIFACAKQLQAPSLQEGFDALYEVHLREDRFELSALGP